jgi:hypothetical protein
MEFTVPIACWASRNTLAASLGELHPTSESASATTSDSTFAMVDHPFPLSWEPVRLALLISRFSMVDSLLIGELRLMIQGTNQQSTINNDSKIKNRQIKNSPSPTAAMR